MAGKDSKKIYNSKRWVRLRLEILAREPLCRQCKKNGVTVGATVVDHVIPLKKNIKLAFARSNLKPLCKSCHDEKTQIENEGGRPFPDPRRGAWQSLVDELAS